MAVGEVRVRGWAVTMARQGAGLTQAQLAEAASLSQGFISKVENAQTEVDTSTTARLAETLHVPMALLTVSDGEFTGEASISYHRRRRSKVSALAARRVDALAHLTALTVHRLLADEAPLFHQPLSNPPQDPVAAAEWARAASGDGQGPIVNVTRVAEGLGVVVVRRDLGTEAQDGVSLAGAGSPAVTIVDHALPGDRARFTLAHELGHLLLHGGCWALDLDPDEAEREANRFAACLLLPPRAACTHLQGVHPRRFGHLLELKQEWGLSMAAMIEQARILHLIEPEVYRQMRMTLTQRGWHRAEPGDVRPELPRLLPNAIDDYLDRRGFSEEQTAAVALMCLGPFRRAYLTHRISGADALADEQEAQR